MKKSEKYAWFGTAIAVLIIALIMLFVVMPSIQKNDEGGIMISFGNADEGAGFNQNQGPESDLMEQPHETEKDALITQKDKSVVMPENKKQDKTVTTSTPKTTNNDQKKKEQQATKNANDLIGGSFGSGTSAGSGNSNSNKNEGNPVGKGTSGGNSWSLSGRNLSGNMPEPAYNQDQEGFITVQIKVDANGNVTSPTIIKASISNPTLRQEALSAAKRTKFTGGSSDVIGTITYNFKLK